MKYHKKCTSLSKFTTITYMSYTGKDQCLNLCINYGKTMLNTWGCVVFLAN